MNVRQSQVSVIRWMIKNPLVKCSSVMRQHYRLLPLVLATEAGLP
jgi:hypothetical protein